MPKSVTPVAGSNGNANGTNPKSFGKSIRGTIVGMKGGLSRNESKRRSVSSSETVQVSEETDAVKLQQLQGQEEKASRFLENIRTGRNIHLTNERTKNCGDRSFLSVFLKSYRHSGYKTRETKQEKANREEEQNG